jgi:GT2 family glycosyltransferase
VPAVDLVLATVERTRETERFLDSLRASTFRDVRLIVVDQNADDRLGPLLGRHELPVLHLRSTERGANRARNVGLRHVEAPLVGFPDDDCWYPADLLERVVDFFDGHLEWAGLCGRSVDEHGRPSNGRWDRAAGRITPLNVWKRATGCTIFLRRSTVEAIGSFDESLGPGAGTDFGASDEIDYVLSAVEAGERILYDPTLCVGHPQTREASARPDPCAGYRYAMGMGHVMRKHGLPWWFAAYHWGRAVGGAGVELARGRPARARFHAAVAVGRVRGWLRTCTSA